MPRFVLLYHQCPPEQDHPSHWDLMFEVDNSLRTWALDALPQEWSETHRATKERAADCPNLALHEVIVARLLPDHRIHYLDYEGPVSNNRGYVDRIEAGTYSILAESPNDWQVRITSERTRGTITFVRDTAAANWLIRYQSA